jgi:tetratricopeptide (TPR) repeat protein
VKVALHDHQGALEDFDRAHELDPCDVGVLKSRGNVKVALHDHQGALEDFDRAHELDPRDVGILRSRGNVKVTLHDHRGALDDFNWAHELAPWDAWILESRGNVKVTLHDHQGALEDFNRAHKLVSHGLGILECRGNVKVALHDHQGALEDFDRAHELDPCHVGVLESRGNVKVALHDHQGALEDFDMAHELDPRDVGILRSRGNVKMTLYDHQGVLQDLDRVHELDSFDVEALRLRGHVKRMMGDLKGSIMDWAMAHGLPCDDIVCFGNRAFVKRRLKNYDGVVGELNHKQEFDFLFSLKKLILQLVVFFVVFVIFVFEYLMGYVERGQWGTYSNGTWEFRATYVCIELRLGSYPFQKFREKPPSCNYIGIHTRKKRRKNGGEYFMYEPRLTLNKVRFNFRECKTRVKAAFIYDIAKLCLGVKDGNFNMLCPQRYDHLPKISVEGLKDISTKEISKIVFDCAESTFQSIKDHPVDGDNQKILKLFEDGGEGCAMNENLASLDSNGGDYHTARCSMGFSDLEALLNSPNDGDVLAIDINEHARLFVDGGEDCAMNENRSLLDSNGGDDHALEALWSSLNDGDVPAIDIVEHAQNQGESTGKHNMTYKPTIF